jgi:hypothetical protein
MIRHLGPKPLTAPVRHARAALALALCLASLSPASASPRPMDRGGRLDVYAQRIAAAQGAHRIAGDCYSACTMWLAYPGACIERSARLWFHGAFDIGREEVVASDGNAIMTAYYPPQVDRIVSPWLRTLRFSSKHTLTGAQLIALGMRACR